MLLNLVLDIHPSEPNANLDDVQRETELMLRSCASVSGCRSHSCVTCKYNLPNVRNLHQLHQPQIAPNEKAFYYVCQQCERVFLAFSSYADQSKHKGRRRLWSAQYTHTTGHKAFFRFYSNRTGSAPGSVTHLIAGN